MTVRLDVSQLLIDPRRTGIQRAERELIRHWPGPAPLRPCRFDAEAGCLRELPDRLLAALCEDAPPGGMGEEMRRLAPLSVPGRPVPRGERVLCAELFGDPARAAFYGGMAGEPVFWLVYDFLPWLEPQWFGAGSARRLMPYVQAMLAVRHLAFISAQTRADWVRRVRRGACEGPVIPMGGDGLGLPPQPFVPGNRDFVLLGTVEPRKNTAAAMRAFQFLWAEGVDASLTVVGQVEPGAAAEIRLLRELDGHPRFRHRQGISDAALRELLSSARAMLFPSEGEGFGIPPMEALHAGIPVIVSARLPALDGVPGLGQVRLDQVDPGSIAAAVRRLLDDEAAARLRAEAARLDVPTWRDFARDAAAWVQQA